MKTTALDEECREARPKRLRFAIFNHVGRVVHHARESFFPRLVGGCGMPCGGKKSTAGGKTRPRWAQPVGHAVHQTQHGPHLAPPNSLEHQLSSPAQENLRIRGLEETFQETDGTGIQYSWAGTSQPRIAVRQRLAYTRKAACLFFHHLIATGFATASRVRELTEGRGARVVLEVVGLPQVIPEGLHMVQPRGTYLELGLVSAKFSIDFFPATLVRNNARYIALNHYEPVILAQALEFLTRNRARYPFEKIVSHQFPLTQINEAFQQAEWFGRRPRQATVMRAAIAPGA